MTHQALAGCNDDMLMQIFICHQTLLEVTVDLQGTAAEEMVNAMLQKHAWRQVVYALQQHKFSNTFRTRAAQHFSAMSATNA